MGSVRGLIGGKFNRESDREFYNYDVYGTPSDTSNVGNPFMFAGYMNDPETGLYHLGRRTYDSLTGRFLQLDPIGYIDSMNLYEYVANNPMMFVDPFGLKKYDLSHGFGDSGEFWNRALNPNPADYFFKVRDQIGDLIDKAANKYCIPKQLLAGVLLNEMTDLSDFENTLEGFMNSPSISYGPGQITPTTADDQKVFGDDFTYKRPMYLPDVSQEIYGPPSKNSYDYRPTIDKLRDIASNVDATGKLIKSYLNDLCKKAKNKQLSNSFSNDIAQGCDISNFCMAECDNKKKNCKEIANAPIPECLLRAMAIMHNNGMGVTGTNNIPANKQAGYAMANWASRVWGYIGIFSDRWQKDSNGKWIKK